MRLRNSFQYKIENSRLLIFITLAVTTQQFTTMKKIPVAIIKPLLLASDETVTILLYGPPDIKTFFTIERVFVLAGWMPFYHQVKHITQSDQEFIEVPVHLLSKMCFYFDLLAKFMDHYGTKVDKEFAESVDYFFEKLKGTVNVRDSEKLFWSAFPEVSRNQITGKPYDPFMRVV